MSLAKLYIAILDDVPDYIVPTLVAHAMLSAHLKFDQENDECYQDWLSCSFRKVVVRVNQKEFNKIRELPQSNPSTHCHLAFESTILNGEPCCAVVSPLTDIPNVLKFAKMWQPKLVNQ